MRLKHLLSVFLTLLTLSVGHMWGTPTSVTINFGTTTNYWNTTSSTTFTDSYSQQWSEEHDVAGNGSVTTDASYIQYGNGSNKCNSFLLQTTAKKAFTLKTFTVTVAGSNGGGTPSSGTISLMKGSTTLKSLAVSGTSSATCSITSEVSISKDDILKVSYSGSKKGMRINQITYSYEETTPPCTNPSTLLSISSSNTATYGIDKTLETSGGNNGTVTWTVANGTGSATVSGNTLTPTGIGTVTVTATQDDNGGKCGKVVNQTITISKAAANITLYDANGSSTPSGTFYGGDPYTPPTTAANCSGKVLVGWSTVEILNEGTKPSSNYADKGTAFTLSAGANNFYAVYATQGGSAPSASSLEFTYASHSGWTIGGTNEDKSTYYLLKAASGSKGYIESPTISDLSTITSVVVHAGFFGGADYGTFEVYGGSTQYGDTESPANKNDNEFTFNPSPNPLSGSGKIKIINAGSNSDANGTRLFSATINYSVGGYTYSNYVTSCCTPLGSINGSFNLSQQKINVTWTGATNVDICYSKNSTKPNTPQFSNVTVCSIDVSSYNANEKCYIWGRQNCGGGATSEWTAISGSYITIPSHTLSITSPNGSVALNPNSTTVVEGRAVQLTATANEGYSFSSWSLTSGTNASLSSTSTNPTTFTMGTTNAGVTATYTPNSYDLSWVTDGDALTGNYTSGSTKYGVSITSPNTPTKTGYTFAGWSPAVAATMPAANTTYTATWTANTNTAYTVKHCKQNIADDNFTEVTEDRQNLAGTTGEDVTPAVKSYEGFTAPVTQTTAILADGSLVITYNYTRNSYDLAWDANGGDALSGDYTEAGSIKYGVTIVAPNTPTKSGWSFNGWSPAFTGTMPADDVTYQAQWVANTHTVTYHANGATSGDVPVDANSPYNHGATAYALDNTGNLQKTHYTFDGWNDGTDDHGVGEDFAVNADMILYAKWACAEYVNVSKGTPSHGTFSVSTGSKYTCDGAVDVEVTDIVPATGYQFSAVTATSGSVNNTTVTFAQYANGSSEINVTFAAKHITVTWNVNGGDDLDDETSEYVYDGSTVDMPTPTRTGYDFAGWYTESEGGSPIDNVGGANKPSADVEYYAHWNVKSYAVTWMISGTAWTTDGQSSVNYGSSVTDLPTPPDPANYCGDKFVGWTDAENGEFVYGISNLYKTASEFPNATEAQTFYAVFADYAN